MRTSATVCKRGQILIALLTATKCTSSYTGARSVAARFRFHRRLLHASPPSGNMSPASVFQDRTSLPKAWGTRIVWQGTGMLVHVSAEEDYGIDLFKAEEEEYGQIFAIIERQFGPM